MRMAGTVSLVSIIRMHCPIRVTRFLWANRPSNR